MSGRGVNKLQSIVAFLKDQFKQNFLAIIPYIFGLLLAALAYFGDGRIIRWLGGGITLSTPGPQSLVIDWSDSRLHLIDVSFVAGCPDDKVVLTGSCRVSDAQYNARATLTGAFATTESVCGKDSNQHSVTRCNFAPVRQDVLRQDVHPTNITSRRFFECTWQVHEIPIEPSSSIVGSTFVAQAEAYCVKPGILTEP